MWFPPVKTEWRLDVVTLLAVIGESSIQDHSQAITASLFGFLPRLIPAPQAMLKPTRPGRMPETLAKMTGVESGTTLDSVGFFANAIMETPLNDYPPFAFKVFDVKHRNPTRATALDVEGQPAFGKLERRGTATKVQNFIIGDRPVVPPKLLSPIHILGSVSCLVSIAIVSASIYWQDGNAIISITLMSLVSTIVGIASFWKPRLMNRTQKSKVPRGDVMIRTRVGAFILIRCTEEVARELYSGTEECEYFVSENMYRFLMAVGTVFLMIAVVLLGNCTWNAQVFIGGSYIILNGLYWCLGMFPRRFFWDLSRYDVIEDEKAGIDASESDPNFTRTLWYAIRETGLIGWVEASGAAPKTKKWDKWLKEAEYNAKNGIRHWNAVDRKNKIMNGGDEDQAANAAPATQVMNE